jgi:mannosyltransferase
LRASNRRERVRAGRFDPAIVAVFAAVVCAAGAARPSLWFDEAATISASSTRSVPELWRLIHNIDAMNGAYYLAMHGWIAIFPATEFWSRLSSCLAVGTAAAGVVVVGKQFSTRTVSVCAGIVFAILPRITWAGIAARSYALTAAAAVWLTVLVVAAARHNAAAVWPLYGLALVASTLLNVFVVLMVLVHAVAVPVVAKNRATVVWWAATSTVALLVVAPFLSFCRAQIAQVRWISPVHPGTVVDIAQEQFFDNSVPFALLGGVVLAAPLVVRRPRETPQSATRGHRAGVDRASHRGVAVVLGGAATDLLPSLPLLHLARDGRADGGLHRGPFPHPRTRHGGAGRVRACGHPELPAGPARPICQGRHGLQPGRRCHHRARVPG